MEKLIELIKASHSKDAVVEEIVFNLQKNCEFYQKHLKKIKQTILDIQESISDLQQASELYNQLLQYHSKLQKLSGKMSIAINLYKQKILEK